MTSDRAMPAIASQLRVFQTLLMISPLLAVSAVEPGLAEIAAAHPAPEAECTDASCRTTYESSFFSIYAPVTALDMVNNLPGFNLNNGNTGSRGFGGAAGNILINGERVSAKSESPSEILARIPAADVERIIVIRGQVGGTDLRGQSVIADVIRKGTGATGTWSARGSTLQPGARLVPAGALSYSDSQGALKYTVGAGARRARFQNQSDEQVFDGNGRLTEFRDEGYGQVEDRFEISLNTTFAGEHSGYGFNVRYQWTDRNGGERSLRQPIGGQAFELQQGSDRETKDLELGLDAERAWGHRVHTKLITLYRQDERLSIGNLIGGAPNAPGQLNTEANTHRVESEQILRLEADFSGIQGHLVEAAIEGAKNRLDSDFELLERIDGVLMPVSVPGARTKVEEQRLDLSIADSFSRGALAVDLEVAAEASEISQTGGFAEQRSFFFWKPSATLTYTLDDDSLLRGRVLRTVGQLNFSDFVSAADLGDDELSLGNPSLSPETAVTLDVTWESAFSSIGLLSLTAFYDWIKDVQDVLPLQDRLEVPGNIGSGWRYGMRGRLTSPLDFLGLDSARLDLSGRWQESGVSDPLTGQERVLSNERAWRIQAELRQDLVRARLGWGLSGSLNDGFTRFGLDEVDRFKGSGNLSGYIESRAIESLRIRLGVNAILRNNENRDRLVFNGPRNVSPPDFRELRNRRRSRNIYLEARGVF
ncbi:MAG: TonB-dependent receptor [Wenzhouxiangella sp.]|nr:TonB-dependent receptor [Wenzhouxiangella sp.]